jgi:hypothetical protein
MSCYRTRKAKNCPVSNCKQSLRKSVRKGRPWLWMILRDTESSDRKDENFDYVTVNYSLGQFSAGNRGHTNDIENFWSLVKRQYIGIHHHYIVKHMQDYLDEMRLALPMIWRPKAVRPVRPAKRV